MKLAIFDIDGTLTNTNTADEFCFKRSVEDFFGLRDVSTDWAAYRHSTDSGILNELTTKAFGSPASEAEMAAFKARFVEHLDRLKKERPEEFREVPGAMKIFSEILKGSQFKVAIATGAWRPSAHFKLGSADIPFSETPFGCAEDAFDRKDIVTAAIRRAEEKYKTTFSKSVYIGDGSWDLKAAKELGIGFLGMDCKADGKKLRDLGAAHIIHDYLDSKKVISILETLV